MISEQQKPVYKKQWTSEEDSLLLKLVQEYGSAGHW
jgi:hypothetical protein